jgi:hypothetical protein
MQLKQQLEPLEQQIVNVLSTIPEIGMIQATQARTKWFITVSPLQMAQTDMAIFFHKVAMKMKQLPRNIKIDLIIWDGPEVCKLNENWGGVIFNREKTQ